MASAISGYINTIRSAVYGEQVRTAIVNALEACYSDVENPNLQSAAFRTAIEAAYADGILDIQTVTSFSAMTNQKIIYRYNGTAAGKQKGLYYYSALSDSWVLIGSEIQKVSLASQMTDTNDIYKYIGTETGMVQNSLYCYNGTDWVPIGSGVLTAATAALMTNTGAIYKYTGTETGMVQNALYYYDGTAWRLVSPVDEELTATVQNLAERVNDLAGVFATTSTGYYNSGGSITENSNFCHTPKIRASRFLPPIDINGNSLVSAVHSVVVFNNGVGSAQIPWSNTESYDQPFDEIGYTFYSNRIPTGTTVYFDTGTFTLAEAERRINAIETGMASFWYNKELSFIGDSIVAGVYSGDGGGVTTETFCKICGEVLGAKKVNSYGYSGVAIYGTNGICTRVSNITTDSDLVVVAAGTNDYAQNVPLGAIADTTNISFYGALYVMCNDLMNRFPGKRIVFVTPINKWSEGANTAGYTLQQYRDAIKEVAADTFGFGVVNGREMGLTYKNASIYLSDGIHPTLLGHKIYGESLAHALNAK